MKTFLMVLGLGISAGMVQAATLSYTSLGALNCGAAANCTGAGGALQFSSGAAMLTISYNSVTVTQITATPPANIAYGSLSLVCNQACGDAPVTFDLAGATLALGVDQQDPFVTTAPSMFQGNFSGTLTSASNGSGGATYGGLGMLMFGPSITTLVGNPWKVDYALQVPVMSFPISNNPQSFYGLSIGNDTSLQGAALTHMPEPGTLASLGAGLIGLGLLGRRRKK